MDGTIVLYPAPGMGHVVSMVELAKLILRRHHHCQLSVAVLITTGAIDTPATTSYINHISQTYPSITFHHFPSLSVPFSFQPSPTRSFVAILADFIRLNNPNVFQALQSISNSSTVKAFVIDFFCTPVFDVASDLNIPTYYFITFAAADLALLLYLPIIYNHTTESSKDNTTSHLQFPGLPPIPVSSMPDALQNPDDQSFDASLNIAVHLPKSKGIIVNTFESLEPRAIKAIADGSCVPDAPTPPVYCIGPLIAKPADQIGDGGGGTPEYISWLDAQPVRSVVFLCFGSKGTFLAAQLKEIATGLEKSGQRFLWVVRNPPGDDHELDVLLPEGFLDRTKERGLVVKSWAQQVEVLSRESVGGFVTHCGWNSVLEAVSAGVPMVAWPLYAEQHINKEVLVEDLKLAMPMEASENGLVSGAEVEKRVRALMESEDGRVLRERSREMRDEALAAWGEGGSSVTAFTKLVEFWKR